MILNPPSRPFLSPIEFSSGSWIPCISRLFLSFLRTHADKRTYNQSSLSACPRSESASRDYPLFSKAPPRQKSLNNHELGPLVPRIPAAPGTIHKPQNRKPQNHNVDEKHPFRRRPATVVGSARADGISLCPCTEGFSWWTGEVDVRAVRIHAGEGPCVL